MMGNNGILIGLANFTEYECQAIYGILKELFEKNFVCHYVAYNLSLTQKKPSIKFGTQYLLDFANFYEYYYADVYPLLKENNVVIANRDLSHFRLFYNQSTLIKAEKGLLNQDFRKTDLLYIKVDENDNQEQRKRVADVIKKNPLNCKVLTEINKKEIIESVVLMFKNL